MSRLTDLLMYFRYYQKTTYLKLLYQFKGLDFSGRIESGVDNLNGYEGCYPINTLIERLNPTQDDCVLDIGCGKGLFLYYARRYPFRRIDGIDYSEALIDVAQTNLSIINDSRLHVYNCDFRNFNNIDDYNYYFVNNPFGRELMELLVQRILMSLKKRPRTIKLIYQFPFSLDVFMDAGFEVVYNVFPNSLLIISNE